MGKRALVCAAIVSACVLGCATPGPFHPSERMAKKNECDGSKKCEVVVDVKCYFTCALQIEYDVVVVTGKKKTDVSWKLAADSPYTFPATGIVIADAGDEFKCGVETDPHTFTCKNNHGKFGVYKYTINVTGPRPVDPLDPWMVND
jgi:hypothetical protein